MTSPAFRLAPLPTGRNAAFAAIQQTLAPGERVARRDLRSMEWRRTPTIIQSRPPWRSRQPLGQWDVSRRNSSMGRCRMPFLEKSISSMERTYFG